MPHFDPFERETTTEKRNDEKRNQRDNELADVLFVMADPAGRRFMHRLLSRTGMYRSSFDENPHNTAFNEGSRNVGLWLTAEIMQIAVPQYTQMIEEQKDAS